MVEVDEAKWCWTQTYTGRQFFLLDPRPEDVDIRDIARGLAYQSRFNGQASAYYSVAEHSVIVSCRCHPSEARYGLLHDAAEAYVGDMVRPLKQVLPAFRTIEDNILAAVFRRFGLAPEVPVGVRDVDARLLATEALQLMSEPPAPWGAMAPRPLHVRLALLGQEDAEKEFLRRFHELFDREGAARGRG